jgi:shikimate dehydrogenase
MTKLYGLIGYPLKNSFSETYFNTRFEREQLDCRYQNFALPNISAFPNILADNPDIKGLNVTIPHKQTIIPFLHTLDPSAAEVGAVNCIRIQPDGQFIGYNTDVYGFEQSLTPLLQG